MLKGIQLDSLVCFAVVGFLFHFVCLFVCLNTSCRIVQHGYFPPLKQSFLPECELDREIQAFITEGFSYFPCTLSEPRFTLHLH